MAASGEQRAQMVMSVNLADLDSRTRARQTVESIRASRPSEAESRVLDRKIRALAQADTGGARIAEDMDRLTAKLRQIGGSGTKRKGLLGRMFGSPERPERAAAVQAERFNAVRADFEAIVASLSRSADIIRQNDVALDAFEADARAESSQIASEIELADSFERSLVAAIEQAKRNQASAAVIHFAEHEVLFPLELERQHLQNLRAVNQQMILSLSILRETNAALIQSVRYVTLTVRNSLETAALLRHTQAALRGEQNARRAGEGLEAAVGTPEGAASASALDASLGELTRTLEEQSAWRRQAAARKAEALSELQELSAKAFGTSDYA